MNTGRVITGQAKEGVKDLMAKGMTEDEAWEKVAPGALRGRVLPWLAPPLEAKLMEDLLGKVAVAPAGAAKAHRQADCAREVLRCVVRLKVRGRCSKDSAKIWPRTSPTTPT